MLETVDAHFATALPFWVIAARLVAAIALGGALGFEREWRKRPAGLRTHILVSVAAATFAIVSIEILRQPMFDSDYVRADPIRLVEAITSGVAFLAAGFIIFVRGEVHGVTTGAGMWLAAAIGLAAGLGLFSVAALACFLGVFVLIAIRRFEVKMNLKDGGSGDRIADDEANGEQAGERRAPAGSDP
ncbi:MgtC/SapB family protein [Oricola cellulosilytica]|uniref:Protein MgtC n=1 Tax=Oricola cellulosilytica TaxID=1429082 RepID=A0A4V2MPX6_9HYPH|nr:MgtC/SapB family protein [Oricola cellulosilytica]TCD15922.1 MgtC/SapB family protein [Oricola cellulosilytica]